MLSQIFLLAGLTAVVVAEPIPQGAATTTLDTSFPTDPAAISSELASFSSLESLLSGIPTLPASVESVLATAVPTESLTATDFACALVTGTPAWYNSLPADVKSALTSYESAVESWYSVHSSQLPSVDTSVTGTYAPVRCTGAVASVQATGSSGTSATKTGSSTSATKSASGTASGSATGASSSNAGGAKPTGAIAASFAGAVGVLGLIAAL